MPEDVFSRASFVLSAKVLDPQFQGQIKGAAELARRAAPGPPTCEAGARAVAEPACRTTAKLAELVIKQAQTRQRAGQKVEKRKGLGRGRAAGQADRLRRAATELQRLFLVEGDSAGGSAKMGRDKETQAILPLRGKVLNAWEVERDRLFANNEIHDIAVAIGVDPHGPRRRARPPACATARSASLSDADVDGSHIQVLLLTLFFRHFPKLIETRPRLRRQPPLFASMRRRAARSRRPRSMRWTRAS